MKKGHVRQRESGSWSVYYDGLKIRGRRNLISKGGFSTEKEAEEYLSDQLYALRKGLLVQNDRISLSQYLTEWLENRKDDLAPNTYSGYKVNIVKHIIPEIGKIKLQELRVLDIEKLYRIKRQTNDSRGSKGLSNTSIRYIHRVLRKALQDAYKKELIMKNVADLATVPKEQEYEATILNEIEIKELIKQSKKTDLYLPIILAVGLGLRRGEVLGLRWCDVDFTNSTVSIKQTVSTDYDGKVFFKPPKTQKSKRTLVIHAEHIKALKEHKIKLTKQVVSINQNEDLVFCENNGMPICPKRFSKKFSNFIAESGLPKVTFHGLRHSYATVLAKHKRSQEDIVSLLGHTSIAVTRRYMHNAPEVVTSYPDELSKNIF